jgi:large subunit ribosomal protein L21
MYAIIRTGGKQAKVHEGDVIDVEHLRAEGDIEFTPLLLVDDAGTVFSQRDVLRDVRVVARVVGESTGPKVDLFKYKAKTGYRRHQGHRQRYTTLEVVRIDAPAGAKKEKPAAPEPAEVAGPTPAAEGPAPKTKAAKAKAAKAAEEPKAAKAAARAGARTAAGKAKPSAGAKKKES